MSVACPALSRAAFYEPSPGSRGASGILRAESRKSKQAPSGTRARTASPHLARRHAGAPPLVLLTGESGIAAGAAPQRESVCGVWILHRAHANDAAALPLHSWLGCLPRLSWRRWRDAPRGRLVVVAAERCCCGHGRRRRFVRLWQLRGARAGPRRAAGLAAPRGGCGPSERQTHPSRRRGASSGTS